MLVRDIVERSSDAPAPPSAPRAPASSSAGFPTILHRSQKLKRPSAFAAANARQARDTGIGRAVEFDDLPKVTSSLQSAGLDSQPEAGPSKSRAVSEKEDEYTKVQREIGDENRRKVAEMSAEERDEEVRELEERFGAGVLAALRKRAEKRAAGAGGMSTTGSDDKPHNTPTSSTPVKPTPEAAAPDPTAALAHRKSVKFASSPPPDAELKSTYFANTPAEPDKLAWMSSSSSDSGSSMRFDLSGRLLSSSQQSELPAHLGLHHHGEQPDLAGYTIDEILLLCRSTVPAQRVGMMGLLAKVIGTHVLTAVSEGEEVRRICAEIKVCEKAVSLCVDVLHSTRNVTLLQVAIELLYTALGGPVWPASSTAFYPEADAQGRAAPISSVPFEDLFHRLSELLTTPDYLPALSIHHLIVILRRASTADRETAETILPLLPPIIQTHVTRRPWPAQTGKLPLLEPLRLMSDLIASSRLCATEIVDAGLPGSLLRFCVISTWEDETLGVDLCTEVLHIFGRLARYGLAAGTARSAHEIWVVLGEHVRSHLVDDERSQRLSEAYLKVLEGWTTCAIDPHRTTPEHDLTWTQIAGLGWAEQALEAVEGAKGDLVVLSAAFELLVAWTIGLGVNEVKGGEGEKAELRRRLAEYGLKKLIHAQLKGDAAGTDRLMLAALRVQALLISGTEAAYPQFKLVDGELLADVKAIGMGRTIQYELLRSTLGARPTPADLKRAFDLLPTFQPGEEPLGLDLLDLLLKLDWPTILPSLSSTIKGIGHSDSITLLRPLLQHAILPSVTNITAPSQIHHLYLKATGSLRSPSPSVPDETGRTPPGLPLRPEWFFHPIDELLHSADSAAFQQAPMDWTPTELEIVRATLVFLRLALAVGFELDTSVLLFGMMKVYMLEHQTGGMVNTGESELFRDDLVKECLGAPLDGLSGIQSGDAATAKHGLETAAIPFLGLEPFYQFYTDLVSLFENASFGDSTFARILLPPLAMSYPADYRKIVWGNPNVIRLIRTPLKYVPLEQGLQAFFEPVENDPEVLSAYGQAIVRGWVKPNQGLLWEVAIHHLRAFFGQAEGEDEEMSAGEKEKKVALDRLRKGLRAAVMGSGNEAVVGALSREGDVQPWL